VEQVERLLQFVLFKTILVIALPASATNFIGNITEVSGNAQVLRDTSENKAIEKLEIASYDNVRTAQGRVALKFLDDSTLKLTEHSSIVIDEFVYDPNPSNSKLALNFTSGTARFISGALGTIDKENIKIKTPTAEIAIRGTDFTATVDETGRTLIILLPDEFGDPSGEIIVSSMMGQVVLNKPYQATTVSISENAPSTPKILDITLELIDNMLIVSPPKEETEEAEERQSTASILDFNDLDVELLDDKLDSSQENLNFSELDIDLLDVDFLTDLLDVFEEIDQEEDEDALQEQNVFAISGTQFGFDPTTQINTFMEGQQVVVYRQVENSVRLNLLQDTGYTIKGDDSGQIFNVLINSGGDVYISIVQQ
jgi:hypothetical protein